MILDGKYLNEEQITKIEHKVDYSSQISPQLYRENPDLYYAKIDSLLTDDFYYIEIKAFKGKFENNENSGRQIHKGQTEFYEIKKKISRNIIKTVEDRSTKKSGRVIALIELSSGSIVEYTVHKFMENKIYNLAKQVFDIDSNGDEFNEKDIDIDYVCKAVFDNTSSNYKKKKVMI